MAKITWNLSIKGSKGDNESDFPEQALNESTGDYTVEVETLAGTKTLQTIEKDETKRFTIHQCDEKLLKFLFIHPKFEGEVRPEDHDDLWDKVEIAFSGDGDATKCEFKSLRGPQLIVNGLAAFLNSANFLFIKNKAAQRLNVRVVVGRDEEEAKAGS